MSNDQTQAEVLEGLAAKIASAGLTAAEAELFDTVLARAAAAGDDVAGHGVVFEVETTFTSPGDVAGMRTRLARGVGLDPGKVWTDMRPLS